MGAQGYLRRLTRRLTEDPEQRDSEELSDEVASTGAQRAIDCERGQESSDGPSECWVRPERLTGRPRGGIDGGHPMVPVVRHLSELRGAVVDNGPGELSAGPMGAVACPIQPRDQDQGGGADGARNQDVLSRPVTEGLAPRQAVHQPVERRHRDFAHRPEPRPFASPAEDSFTIMVRTNAVGCSSRPIRDQRWSHRNKTSWRMSSP